MKKISILSIVAMAAILAFTSCNKYEGKSVSLKSQNDSLNYALGLTNGQGIKDNFLHGDSTDKPVAALIKGLDEAYKIDLEGKSEIYKVGIQVGSAIKEQKAKGLMMDSTLKFDENLVKQGIVNAVNGFGEGMTPKQAQEYVQATMMKIQMRRQAAMMQQAPQQAAPQQPAPQPAK